MSSHTKKSQTDTRTRILEATWRLLEKRRGQGVRMSDIAKATGVSRQAVYLHFATRSELMIATTKYVDEIKGLEERLKIFQAAQTGPELLDAVVEFWGNYIPEIYGIAKAMLSALDSDEAMAAAWSNCMGELQGACQHAVDALAHEKRLATEWSQKDAVDMFMTTLSIHNWEQLTMERGWSSAQYVAGMKTLLRRCFIKSEG